jgi:hypothetical protein
LLNWSNLKANALSAQSGFLMMMGAGSAALPHPVFLLDLLLM